MFEKLKNRKPKKETFVLNSENTDKITKMVYEYALANGVDPKTANRYTFLIDNTLFRWSERGEEGREITIVFGHRMFCPVVELRLAGAPNDPFENEKKAGFADAGSFIMTASLAPEYAYTDGVNVIRLKLLKERNMMVTISVVLLSAVIVGIGGNLLLAPETRELILSSLLDPFMDTFYDLLRCIAGPMVFLTVAWGICGIGDSRLFGIVGKKVMLFCIASTFIGACIGALCFPLYQLTFTTEISAGSGFRSLLEMILDIIPSTIIEPFATGNTLQIIFMAIAVGTALVVLSEKVRNIVTAVNQINYVIQYLMGFISMLVPYIVFLMVVKIIWQEQLKILLETWKLFLGIGIAFTLISVFFIGRTSISCKVSPWLIIKKNLITFLVALTTASSAAAFSSNMNSARKGYGINENLAGFSIPLGMIAHNPVTAGYNLIIVMYAASVYGVSVSPVWFITGILVGAVVAISIPPIPGGAAVCYAVLLAQMGIPEDALSVLLIVDVITDFLVTAYKSFLLPISLTTSAKNLNMLNMDILKKDGKNAA